MSDAPQRYRTAGGLLLASGILNVLSSAMWVGLLVELLGLGLLWLVPLALGVFEIVVGIAALRGRPHPRARLASSLGIASAVVNLNLLAVALEIVALVTLRHPEVVAFLARGRNLRSP